MDQVEGGMPGSHFDPVIVESFEACSRDLLGIFEANADAATALAA